MYNEALALPVPSTSRRGFGVPSCKDQVDESTFTDAAVDVRSKASFHRVIPAIHVGFSPSSGGRMCGIHDPVFT